MRRPSIVGMATLVAVASVGLIGVAPAGADAGSVGIAHLTTFGGQDAVCLDYNFKGALAEGGGHYVGLFRLGRLCAPQSGLCGPHRWCTTTTAPLRGTNAAGQIVNATCFSPQGGGEITPLNTATDRRHLRCHGSVAGGHVTDFTITPYVVGNLFAETGLGDPFVTRSNGIYVGS